MSRIRLLELIGFTLMLGILIAVASLVAANAPSPPIAYTEPSDVAHLRELVTRLLGPKPPGSEPEPLRLELLPGALPEDFQAELPLPPDGRLVGSVVANIDALPAMSSGEPLSIDVALDAMGEMRDVLDFYERALAEHGWSPGPPTSYATMGGFQPKEVQLVAFFCQMSPPRWLTLTAKARDGLPNEVRLRVELQQSGPCRFPEKPGMASHPDASRLPRLYAPDDVPVQVTGGDVGGPFGRFSSAATANTPLSPAELEALFAAQLQAAGWTRLDGAVQEPLAWSTWDIPDDDGWQGFLYVLQAPGQNRRDLYVQVVGEAAPIPGGDGMTAPITGAIDVPAAAPGTRR